VILIKNILNIFKKIKKIKNLTCLFSKNFLKTNVVLKIKKKIKMRFENTRF